MIALVAVFLATPIASGRVLTDDTLSGRVLTDAVRVIPLPKGRLVALFHLDGLPQDPTAVGALMIGKDGREWQLRASAFVPQPQLLAGSGGQIYGAAISDDEQAAALSIGWLTPAREGRNGIVVLQKGPDRLFHPSSFVACNVGVGDVAFTANGDIAAVTRFAAHRSAVTVYKRTGAIAGEFFDDLVASGRRSSDLLMVRVDASRYALVDRRNGTLYRLQIGSSGTILGSVDLNAGLPSRGTLGPIQTVAMLASGEVLAVRQRVNSTPYTIVTLHSAAKTARWQIGRPSRTAFWNGEKLSIVTSVGARPFLQQFSLQEIRKGATHVP